MNNKIIQILIFVFMLLFFTNIFSLQPNLKRSRGEGMYRCENPNTVGKGNIWAGFTALGFIWDSDTLKNQNIQRPEPYAFPEIFAKIGVFNFMSFEIKSRPISYGWKFGWISAGTKFCLLKNRDIRFQNAGLKITYHHNFLKEIASSIAGYRNSHGTGFSPEGFIVHGGNLILKGTYVLDFLSINSKLPLKINACTGINIPLNKTFKKYSQYLINIGVAYIGLSADVFIEYSLEAFVNRSTEPKIFSFNWEGWGKTTKKWEVAFAENPMYLTIGGRMRYSNGIVLYVAVPLLLSQNVGSAMTETDKIGLDQGKFPEEKARGITDPFDPWYTKWKIILKISYPFRYKQTSTEMRRNFLLLKNRKEKKRIDIDKEIETDEVINEK